MSGFRSRFVALAVLLTVAAMLSPWGQWRIRLLAFKFAGNAPEWSWVDVLESLVPLSKQSRVMTATYEPPVAFVERDHDSPCPVLWDTPLGPMWAWFLDRPYLVWHTRRWPLLSGLFPEAPSIPRGGVVLEVGAWVGTFVREALRQGARKVIAIEPEPSNFVCLEKNLAEDVAQGRVVLVKAAAWHVEGTARFGHPAFDENGIPQAGGEGFTALEDGDTVVKTVRIDDLVRELGLKTVDFSEMDIEGTERHALAGARQTLARFSPEIVVCVHHLPDDPEVIHQTILTANPAYRRSVERGHALYRVAPPEGQKGSGAG